MQKTNAPLKIVFLAKSDSSFRAEQWRNSPVKVGDEVNLGELAERLVLKVQSSFAIDNLENVVSQIAFV